MPKINIVGMVVLCLAVFAGAAVLALRSTPKRVETPRVGRLIRLLADTDPDLRREAELELKELGKKAEPALKEAAEGSDPVVAERARAILGLKVPSKEKTSEVATTPEPPIRLTLQFASAPRRPGDAVHYYLRLHNNTKDPVAVARRRHGDRHDYRGFGFFERIDAEGRLVEIADPSPVDEDSEVEVVTLAPGELIDMFPGAGLLAIGARGTYRVRYVYDATETGAYRGKLTSAHHPGKPLPRERLESNSLTITTP